MSEMDQTKIRGTYLNYVNHMVRLDMLVIDDFGLMDLDLDICRDFFEVINLKSTVIVSQLPVKSWHDLFADNTYADACLDRIIHKAYRLELNGKNILTPDLIIKFHRLSRATSPLKRIGCSLQAEYSIIYSTSVEEEKTIGRTNKINGL